MGTVIRFPRPHPKQREYHSRNPGELTSRRLYLTGSRTTPTDAAARAWELYMHGAPCWKRSSCILRIGHVGDCELPKSSDPDRDSGVFLVDGAQVVETEVEEA